MVLSQTLAKSEMIAAVFGSKCQPRSSGTLSMLLGTIQPLGKSLVGLSGLNPTVSNNLDCLRFYISSNSRAILRRPMLTKLRAII
jgi:hypothetical protein